MALPTQRKASGHFAEYQTDKTFSLLPLFPHLGTRVVVLNLATWIPY